MYEKKPWLKYYEDYIPETINYPRKTMYEAIYDASAKYPNRIAYDF